LMQSNPQDAIYTPDPHILSLADWLGDPVAPADFPDHPALPQRSRSAGGGPISTTRHGSRISAASRHCPAIFRSHCRCATTATSSACTIPNWGMGAASCSRRCATAGRLMDLGTKGSGQTPWSRQGDGRLTLKGAMREVLATEMLEALGVNTSRTFSVIETGESLWRGDEPPHPRRGAGAAQPQPYPHRHVPAAGDAGCARRDGTARRLLPGQLSRPRPSPDAPEPDNKAARLLHQVVERMADMAASYMVAGFVHGVLNTDNMNVTGESFDYGPGAGCRRGIRRSPPPISITRPLRLRPPARGDPLELRAACRRAAPAFGSRR
jgi:hypothetical protein